MNRILFFIFVFAIMVFSCKKSSYTGYSLIKDGLHYKLIKFGESLKKPNPGDYITAEITYRTINDSVFFLGKRKFQLSKPSYSGSIDDCFMLLNEGDSASFIISADNFFRNTLNADLPSFIPENSDIKIDIFLLEVQTLKEYQNEKEAFLKWIEDFDEYEKIILKQFIEEEEITVAPSNTGLYYIPVKKGRGKVVEIGDTVVVHYEGKFLNGKFFDSTKKRNEAFEFVFGQKWQVIEGLEEAIGMMKQGEKALVIIPSNIGFGQGGSSTGIIPPFTSIIFEVELLQVRAKV
ncbi:FKBP-type peptidyl-prolyl cis-trans isomerase [Bacteroidota bacterium]